MKKILIVRVGRVGDMVMITPALRALLNNYPDAELHLITSPEGARVLRNFDSRLTEIKVYDRKALLAYFQKQKLTRFIAAANYTDIYCFELNPRYLRMFVGSTATVHTIENYTLKENYAAQCLDVVSKVTQANQHEWIQLDVTEQAKAQSTQLLTQAGVNESDIVIGLHPSFSGLKKTSLRNKVARHERCWPASSWASLAKKLINYGATHKIRLKVIMDLLEEDRELGEEIHELSDGGVTLLIPPANFERYTATIQRMQLLVTPNTGPMHIAGAVGTNMVTLFSRERPDNCGPYVELSQYTALCSDDTEHPEKGLPAISSDAVFAACLPYIVHSQ